mmetsp:Transcript_40912/g.80732  ORF Transcript_40912/g.80732 Transcript_40912/m.80732 type:complete len:148 (+) Transcript_40912:151-594(+)
MNALYGISDVCALNPVLFGTDFRLAQSLATKSNEKRNDLSHLSKDAINCHVWLFQSQRKLISHRMGNSMTRASQQCHITTSWYRQLIPLYRRNNIIQHTIPDSCLPFSRNDIFWLQLEKNRSIQELPHQSCHNILPPVAWQLSFRHR